MIVPPYVTYSGGGQIDRLQPLEEMFDRGTTSHLLELGVGPGWRCLEAGAGAGSIACWLAGRVAPGGSVVAADFETSLLEQLRVPNLEVRRIDLTEDELVPSEFDLVHARLLLEHLPDRDAVLGKLVSALRPGGWILIEDMDWDALHPVTEEGAEVFRRTAGALRQLFATSGYDPRYGQRLQHLLERHGLREVGSQGRTRIVTGGGEWARSYFTKTLEEVADVLLAMGLLTREQIAEGMEWGTNPACAGAPAMLVAAWGRRP